MAIESFWSGQRQATADGLARASAHLGERPEPDDVDRAFATELVEALKAIGEGELLTPLDAVELRAWFAGADPANPISLELAEDLIEWLAQR
jgi:hypothetical protein